LDARAYASPKGLRPRWRVKPAHDGGDCWAVQDNDAQSFCALLPHCACNWRFSINSDFIFLFLRDSRSCEIAKVAALSTR
jgi:hypothetical protein